MAATAEQSENVENVLRNAESGTTLRTCSMDAALVTIRLLHSTREKQWIKGHIVVVTISNDTDNTLLLPEQYASYNYFDRMPTNIPAHATGFMVAFSSIALQPRFSFKGVVTYKISGLFVNEPFSILQVGWVVHNSNRPTDSTAQCGINIGREAASSDVFGPLVDHNGLLLPQTPVRVESGRLSVVAAMIVVNKKEMQYLLTVKLSERPREEANAR